MWVMERPASANDTCFSLSCFSCSKAEPILYISNMPIILLTLLFTMSYPSFYGVIFTCMFVVPPSSPVCLRERFRPSIMLTSLDLAFKCGKQSSNMYQSCQLSVQCLHYCYTLLSRHMMHHHTQIPHLINSDPQDHPTMLACLAQSRTPCSLPKVVAWISRIQLRPRSC